MAQNGGTRHTRTASPPSTLPVGVGTSEMRDRITLSQPRPDGLRSGNYYTETPLRPIKSALKNENGAKLVDSSDSSASRCAAAVLAPVHRTRICPAPVLPRNNRSCTPCVTFTKDKKRVEKGGVDGSDEKDSILCTDCGKCKCLACREPRSLPSRWICNSRYECSAEALLDMCTCMCCVKGVFYHCTKDYDMDDDVSCADRPCSCSADRRCVRWSCMGVLSVLMPCLLCYWPLKGCMVACETCYARYHSRGCECTNELQNTQSNKRLLDPNNC